MDFETCAVAGCFSFTGPSIYIYIILYICYYVIILYYIYRKAAEGLGFWVDLVRPLR